MDERKKQVTQMYVAAEEALMQFVRAVEFFGSEQRRQFERLVQERDDAHADYEALWHAGSPSGVEEGS